MGDYCESSTCARNCKPDVGACLVPSEKEHLTEKIAIDMHIFPRCNERSCGLEPCSAGSCGRDAISCCAQNLEPHANT